MTTTMDVNQAKHHLVELLDLAKDGNEVLISEDNTAMARITAISSVSDTRKPRVAGLHAGAIDVSHDFDAELSDGLWNQS